MEAIRSRRTVKKFDQERPVSADLVDQVVEAGTWAPNHHMTEPWRFVVISGDARRRLGEALLRGLARGSAEPVSAERASQERAKPLSAPVIVALISSPSPRADVPQEELVAAGAALQNMLLAAHSLGLGGFVRTGAHAYSEEVQGFLGIRKGEALVGMVYLGYPDGMVPPGKRSGFRDRVSRLES